VEHRRNDIIYVGSGVIKAGSKKSRPERLYKIKRDLDYVLERYNPTALAVEEIFMAKNPKSTLALGEVRGVILLAAAEAGIPVYEYTPREVKGSVVGMGAAHKRQVAKMISRLLKLNHEPENKDETDALAVAFCHVLRESGIAGRLR
jgi:crossover junction endodeoxyribonuclease RuvC